MSTLGYIDDAAAAAIGRPAGPIKLLEGIPGPKGYGAAHLESNANRMKQLRSLGYPSAMSFVKTVAASWTRISAGDDDRLILIHLRGGYDLRLIVAWTEPAGAEAFWSVITGIPSRVVRGPMLYEKPEM